MISKHFLKSSIIFTIGGALPMLASIILMPFYVGFLSDEQYKQVLFYISISLLFQILFSYSIESYFGIEYTRLHKEPEKQKKFIGTISVLLLVIGALLLLISALFGEFVIKTTLPGVDMEFWPFGFYSVITAFFNAYFKVSTVCLIYLKRARLFMMVNVINFIFTLGISVGGMYLYPNTIYGPLYGRLLSGVVIFILAYFILSSNGKFVFEKSFLKDLTKFCTPYLIFALSGWVLGQIDRYFLQRYIPTIDLNAYDLILKCFFGIEFLQNSLSAIIFPKVYELWTKHDATETTTETNRYFNVFTVINVLQLVLFCIFIPLLYNLIIKKEGFYQAQNYIGALAAGYALRSILNFYLSTILYSKKIFVLLKIFGFSALFQIVVTFFASHYYGLNGAIYAGIVTKIMQALFCVIFTKGVFTYTFNYFKILGIPFIYLATNIIQYILVPEFNIWLYIGQFILFSLIFYFAFKNEIGAVAKQFIGSKK